MHSAPNNHLGRYRGHEQFLNKINWMQHSLKPRKVGSGNGEVNTWGDKPSFIRTVYDGDIRSGRCQDRIEVCSKGSIYLVCLAGSVSRSDEGSVPRKC